MGEGWHLEFDLSHFDFYSPPDLYVEVRNRIEPKNQTFPNVEDKRLYLYNMYVTWICSPVTDQNGRGWKG